MMIGIGLLVFAMLLSARMGVYQVLCLFVLCLLFIHDSYQEVLYSRHGKHAKEALFYTHALPLPGFLLLGRDIVRSQTVWLDVELGLIMVSLIKHVNQRHWNICLASTPISVLPFLPPIPTMLLQLVGNVIPQVKKRLSIIYSNINKIH